MSSVYSTLRTSENGGASDKTSSLFVNGVGTRSQQRRLLRKSDPVKLKEALGLTCNTNTYVRKELPIAVRAPSWFETINRVYRFQRYFRCMFRKQLGGTNRSRNVLTEFRYLDTDQRVSTASRLPMMICHDDEIEDVERSFPFDPWKLFSNEPDDDNPEYRYLDLDKHSLRITNPDRPSRRSFRISKGSARTTMRSALSPRGGGGRLNSTRGNRTTPNTQTADYKKNLTALKAKCLSILNGDERPHFDEDTFLATGESNRYLPATCLIRTESIAGFNSRPGEIADEEPIFGSVQPRGRRNMTTLIKTRHVSSENEDTMERPEESSPTFDGKALSECELFLFQPEPENQKRPGPRGVELFLPPENNNAVSLYVPPGRSSPRPGWLPTVGQGLRLEFYYLPGEVFDSLLPPSLRKSSREVGFRRALTVRRKSNKPKQSCRTERESELRLKSYIQASSQPAKQYRPWRPRAWPIDEDRKASVVNSNSVPQPHACELDRHGSFCRLQPTASQVIRAQIRLFQAKNACDIWLGRQDGSGGNGICGTALGSSLRPVRYSCAHFAPQFDMPPLDGMPLSAKVRNPYFAHHSAKILAELGSVRLPPRRRNSSAASAKFMDLESKCGEDLMSMSATQYRETTHYPFPRTTSLLPLEDCLVEVPEEREHSFFTCGPQSEEAMPNRLSCRIDGRSVGEFLEEVHLQYRDLLNQIDSLAEGCSNSDSISVAHNRGSRAESAERTARSSPIRDSWSTGDEAASTASRCRRSDDVSVYLSSVGFGSSSEYCQLATQAADQIRAEKRYIWKWFKGFYVAE